MIKNRGVTLHIIGFFFKLLVSLKTNYMLRDDYKTNAGSVRFRSVSTVLNNDNRQKPDGTAGQLAIEF